MNSTKIKGSNKVFHKPAKWDESVNGVCGDLHVRECCEGIHYSLESAWLPSAADLQKLNAGHAVVLTIAGRSMPPVMLHVSDETYG